jgi:4-amino-4-deoxy-L-arabinose transferase-like glycosyltransferase
VVIYRCLDLDIDDGRELDDTLGGHELCSSKDGPQVLQAIAGRPARFQLQLASVALVALAGRVVFVLAVRHHHAFGYDATWYHTVANRLADGDGYTVRCPLISSCVPENASYFPPGYPLVLAFGALLGAHSFLSQQILSALLGTGTVVMVGLLARRLAGPRAGLAAALIAALYPIMAGADVALMSESLSMLIVSALILVTYWAIKGGRPSRWAAVGALGGVCILVRSLDAVILVVVLLLFALLWLRVPMRRRLLFVLVAAVVASVIVSPWLLRNAFFLGSRLSSGNPVADAVRGANCASTYSGSQLGSWDFGCVQRGANGTRALNGGVHYALDHLGRLPIVIPVRVLRTWGLYAPRQEAAFEEDEGRHRPVQIAGSLEVLALLPMGGAGVIILRRRGVPVWPLLAAALAVTVASAGGFGDTRFRAAAEPSIVVGAAVAIVALGERVVSDRRRGAVGPESSPVPV